MGQCAHGHAGKYICSYKRIKDLGSRVTMSGHPASKTGASLEVLGTSKGQ